MHEVDFVISVCLALLGGGAQVQSETALHGLGLPAVGHY